MTPLHSLTPPLLLGEEGGADAGDSDPAWQLDGTVVAGADNVLTDSEKLVMAGQVTRREAKARRWTSSTPS